MKTFPFIGLLILVLSSCVLGQDTAFDNMLKTQYKYTVPFVYYEQLGKSISTDKELILLDTRELNEYKVSHIKNSRHVGYHDFNLESIVDIPKDSKIIVYCSIGWRSERIGEILIREGFENVYNLYGGIFGWINEGYQVYNIKKEKTDYIHSYNIEWGKWLTQGVKTY